MVEVTQESKELVKTREKAAFGGTIAEGIAGMGAVALAIIGLANIYPQMLVSVAVIAIGVALAFEGGAISARYSALMEEEYSSTDVFTRHGGVTSLFLAGAVGIALGILSLVNVVPMILIPVTAIVYGSALIMDSGANARLSILESRHSDDFKASEHMIKETTQASAGVQVLVGVGSVALGILALIGLSAMVLCLVAMLSIGVTNLMTGALIGGRIRSMLR